VSSSATSAHRPVDYNPSLDHDTLDPGAVAGASVSRKETQKMVEL